jgi:hypothetical protein
MNIFYVSASYENWVASKEFKKFGIKSNLPNIEPGNLILARLTGHSHMPYGVKAIWRCDQILTVNENMNIPFIFLN